MKKMIVIVLFILIFTVPAYAGDEPERLLSDDNAKIFAATIMNVSRETIDVKVNRKIKGDLAENNILTLPRFEYDSKKNTEPTVGDSCLITMINNEIMITMQTTSTDAKTLKFLNHTTNIGMNMEGLSVYERLEKYVNDGSYEAAEQKRLSKLDKELANNQNIAKKTAENTQTDSKKAIADYFTPKIYLSIGVIVLAVLLFSCKHKVIK